MYAVFGDALKSLEIAAAGINWRYTYDGGSDGMTNDESVKAFYSHSAVKADRAKGIHTLSHIFMLLTVYILNTFMM